MNHNFLLRDKTIILTGPLTSYHQSIANNMTQMGADIAFVNDDLSTFQRFVSQLNDQREINEKYGRAMILPSRLNSLEEAKDVTSKVAETFGGIDAYIDGHLYFRNTIDSESELLENFDDFINHNLRPAVYLSYSVLPFLKGRQKGRIIFLVNNPIADGLPGNSLAAVTRGGLVYFARTLAKEALKDKVTVNTVGIGITEEYLRQQFPECSTPQEGIEKMQTWAPQASLTDSERIANTLIFLCSNLSSGVTGQQLSAGDGLLLG